MVQFLTDQGFLTALTIFFVGLVVRAVLYVRGLDWRLDRVAYAAHPERGIPGAAASILAWLVPGGSRGWRAQPFMAAAFFCFHVGAVPVPLFLLGHTVVLENLTGIRLPSLPMGLADALTALSILGLILLAGRRLASAELRLLTTKEDWFILVLTALPLLTGALARLGGSASETWMLCHLISGEVFLIVAPFTKLAHIVLYFLSRAQIGMDFAVKRGGATRGALFPW